MSRFKVNKMASATPTFMGPKGQLLKNLRNEIQRKLKKNPNTNANSLRKFVNEELEETNIILSNNDKNNLMKRLVYDYASLRRKNLN